MKFLKYVENVDFIPSKTKDIILKEEYKSGAIKTISDTIYKLTAKIHPFLINSIEFISIENDIRTKKAEITDRNYADSKYFYQESPNIHAHKIFNNIIEGNIAILKSDVIPYLYLDRKIADEMFNNLLSLECPKFIRDNLKKFRLEYNNQKYYTECLEERFSDMNQELQSTNIELAAANEELRRSNEKAFNLIYRQENTNFTDREKLKQLQKRDRSSSL